MFNLLSLYYDRKFYLLYFQVFALVNDVLYGAGSYLIYVDWQQNPGGAQPATPTPA